MVGLYIHQIPRQANAKCINFQESTRPDDLIRSHLHHFIVMSQIQTTLAATPDFSPLTTVHGFLTPHEYEGPHEGFDKVEIQLVFM